MALTRKMLAAMGIESDKVDQIIESHSETVEGLKKQAEELRETASKVPALEKEIEDMKAAQPTKDWKAEYEELKAEYDGYKDKVANEQAEQEKARLYRSMLREAGVDEKRIDSIMKVTDMSAISVADGAIADSETVKEAIAKEWGDFIAHTNTQGAHVDNPPSNSGAKMTRDEIMAIKDTSARQQAIAENIEQFR
jgi:hypothetical protein